MTSEVSKSTAGTTAPANLLSKLESSDTGLTVAQVAERKATYGPNTLTKDHATALRVFLRQFESPLVYFLTLAAGLSYATRDVADGSIIVAILLVNAVLGFSQEYRSERAVEKLASLISNKVSVKRAGSVESVDESELVPGDVVLMKEGDVVPADMKLLAAQDVEVDESQITGESAAVAKAVQVGDAEAGDGSLLFTGSVVDSGELTGVVYATGNATSLGSIAAMSRGVHKVTQYAKSMGSFSTMLTRIVLCSLAVTVVIKLAISHGTVHIAALLVFVIALAVSVVPEALPVIATLSMARGAMQLAKQHVVVKRLSSLEDLGDVTLLCSDKTGTLTEGKLTVTRVVSSDDDLFETLVAASSDAASTGQEGTQASFDSAFAAFAPDAAKQKATSYTIAGEVPFDPAARRRRVLLSKVGTTERTLVVIGSPETLLDLAATPLHQQYLDQIATEGRQGMRHLGVAYRSVEPSEQQRVLGLEHDLSFLGFATLSDPLRPGIADTIAAAKGLGVSVKILTGDSPDVAAYVAAQVGLGGTDATVPTGDDVAKLSDADLATEAKRSNVFARVSPEEKYRLIGTLEKSEVVGYQGDGINDAPSLKLADVGIAVNSATDVAKANADIILLDPGLGVIVNGIGSGRAIFTNINKYVVYTMVGNFGNFIALTILYLLATNLPLLPRQLLLISLLTDVPLVSISTDSVEASELARPSKYDPRQLLSLSLVLGGLTAAAELVFFATLHGQAASVRETSLYLFLSFTQLVVIFSVRSRRHFWHASRLSWQLLSAMALTGLLTVAVCFIPALARLFGFTAPSAHEVGIVLGASAVYFLALDVLKVGYFKLTGKKQSPPPSGMAQRPRQLQSTT